MAKVGITFRECMQREHEACAENKDEGDVSLFCLCPCHLHHRHSLDAEVDSAFENIYQLMINHLRHDAINELGRLVTSSKKASFITQLGEKFFDTVVMAAEFIELHNEENK